MNEPISIVWLKRDLRVEDHLAFFEARKRGRVIALYVVEPDYWRLPDTSGRQWWFIRESLLELEQTLGKLGIPLMVHVGQVEDALSAISHHLNIHSVLAHEETGNHWTYQRDQRVAATLQGLGIQFKEFQQHGVFRNLDTRNGWARRWDAMMHEAGPPLPARQEWPTNSVDALNTIGLQSPAALQFDVTDICPGRQKGGRQNGLELLASFLGGRGETYRKAMSSPLEGADACSRISTHLAYGTLSMREVFQAAVAALGTLDKQNPTHKSMRQSLISFISRLHWHCHFIQKLETTPAIEWQELHPAYREMRVDHDKEVLERWFEGQTGWPFLDACMRSLRDTGWLNFRMRAMVMAVSSYHFWQPWQKSGPLLGSLFTDYEPGIHWPQVQMQSGTTGINTIRIYNPIKQGYDQDPDGVFIKRWVPELRGLDGKMLHEPWKLDKWPEHYQPMMADHVQSARLARERIWAARKQKGFGKHAKKVLEKHSSRKSLQQPDHRKRAKQAANDDQLGFEF